MTNRYGIYLDDGTTTVRFPVNPEELTVEYPEKNERYDVLALGEIVQPRSPGLAKISWKGLLPGSATGSWVLNAGEFQPPEYYISFLNRLKAEQQWATLIIDRHMEDGTAFQGPYWASGDAAVADQKVVVEDFEVTEKAGETGDFYYDLTLTEYRPYLPAAPTFVQKEDGSATAVAEKRREVPKGQLAVGTRVTVNGSYFYTSYGEEPHGSGSGRTAVVGKLITTDPARACPILLKTEAGGLLGWCRAEAVTAL